tara:strand:+ start:1479 stop:2543 length:1065 start_codon:yes stop_codon:yes gene_type:complete
MGQFLQVNGDYNIKAGEGAKIVLDTGPAATGGRVVITGNLVVQGETLAVEATNLNITDNVITLNTGEDGPGVTLDYSGIEIDRGDTTSVNPSTEPQNNASFLWDEINNTWILAHGTAPGPFNYTFSRVRLKEILTSSTTDTGDLTLIGTGTGVVKVFGTTNYEDQVTADDDLPNKKYVDDAILNNPTFQIVAPQSQDTRVIITDKDLETGDPLVPGSESYLQDQTGFDSNGESAISIIIDGELTSQIFNNRFEIGNLELGGGENRNELTTKDSITNENIYIRTQGTGKLQTNYALQLEKINVTPAYVADNTVIYAAEPGIGTSGVWFQNDSAETAKRSGELISKNKALVFSMLF